MSAPSFQAAFDALTRIRPNQHQRYIPIPDESLQLAFTISPAFARLKPSLDGAIGEAWRTETFNRLGVRGEIGVNWLLWAIRNAASENGIHATADEARRFYETVAAEINTAGDEGRVPTRTVWASFIGPNLFREAHHLPGSLGRLLRLFVSPADLRPLRDDADLLPEERALYDRIVLRRASGETRSEVREFAKHLLAGGYRWVVIGLAIAAGASAVLIVLRRPDSPPPGAIGAALALLAVAIVSRIGLFTVIDATSWPVAYDRFLFPVMPIASILLVGIVVQTARLRAVRAAAG